MKIPSFPVVVAVALLCSLIPATAASNSIEVPLPGGQTVPAVLDLIDESGSNWKSLPVTLAQSEKGFDGTFSTSSGASSNIQCKFEPDGNKIKYSVKWEGSEGAGQTFIMFVMVFPVEEVADTVLASGKETIEMSKLIAGQPARASFDQTTAFSMGPVGGKNLEFECETPLDIGVTILQGKDFAHLRIYLTPRKTELPASGEVAWSVSE